MLKQSVKTTIYTVCNDTPIEFDDSVDAGKGTAAAEQLGHNIYIVDYDDSGDVFIPAHAVCMANVVKTSEEVEIVDDTCPSDEESE